MAARPIYDNAPGVVLTRLQVAQIAYQAGARAGDLEFLVALPERESSYRPGIHGSDAPREALTGDRGLWQINSTWDQQLISAGIIRQASDLFDPLTNARAAMYVLQHQGRSAWGMGASGYAAGGDPYKGLNVPAAVQAVRDAASRGLLGQDYRSGSNMETGGGFMTSSGAPGQLRYGTDPLTGRPAAVAGDSGELPFDLPRDAILVRNQSATVALFNLGNGIYIHYALPMDGSINLGGRPVQSMTNAQYLAKFGRTVSGGHAEELRLMATDFGSYREHWNRILDTVIGRNNPARNDPDVLRVLAEYAGRPDMEQAELENKLQGTKWFQSRTSSELEWNSLAAAEQRTRRQEMATRMAQQWSDFTGETISANDRRITASLEAVVSGKMGFGHWTETVVKPAALKNSESPYARDRRTEQEAQRERGITIENTTARIRDELERYGLTWDAKTLTTWAKNIVEKRKSDDDLVQAMERGAEAQFPGLGPLKGADVATMAAPWLETYERTMEKKGSLYTPEVRRALAQGALVWDFEKELTKSTGWLKTRNADERMHEANGQLAELFGY